MRRSKKRKPELNSTKPGPGKSGPKPAGPVKVIAPWARRALPIQASLKVNTPGDKHEQEAARTADQVMSAPDSALQRETCACGRPAVCRIPYGSISNLMIISSHPFLSPTNIRQINLPIR